VARAAAGSGRGAKPSAKAESKLASTGAGTLERYWAKRDFGKTPEPRGAPGKPSKQPAFVIQKHHASTLHYDFRLEVDGVMKSWAVPKGPSYDPSVKRMAVQVEDHPVSYNSFEGTIPKGQYGAGTVIIWDRGTWEPLGDPRKGLADGKLAFRMHGEKMQGLWELVRMRKPGEQRQDPWLLFKKHDEFERPADAYDVVSALPDSVVSKPGGKRAPPTASLDTPAAEPLRGAMKAALPHSLSPQLATLAGKKQIVMHDNAAVRVLNIADGEKQRLIAEAEGRASAIRVQGEAEADIIFKKGEAEAKAMNIKAEAYQEYNQAAVVDKLITGLPEVVRAMAAPLANVDKITIVSTGNGHSAGMSKITGDMAEIAAQVPALFEALSGMQIKDLLANVRLIGDKSPKPPNDDGKAKGASK